VSSLYIPSRARVGRIGLGPIDAHFDMMKFGHFSKTHISSCEHVFGKVGRKICARHHGKDSNADQIRGPKWVPSETLVKGRVPGW
jgi:hypothetical protein